MIEKKPLEGKGIQYLHKFPATKSALFLNLVIGLHTTLSALIQKTGGERGWRWSHHLIPRSGSSASKNRHGNDECRTLLTGPPTLDKGTQFYTVGVRSFWTQGGKGERGRSWVKGARDCLLAFASDRNGGGAAHLLKCRRFYCTLPPLPPLPAPPLIAVDTKHQPLNDGRTQVPAASFTWPRACESGDGNTRSQTRRLFARRNH